MVCWVCVGSTMLSSGTEVRYPEHHHALSWELGYDLSRQRSHDRKTECFLSVEMFSQTLLTIPGL